MSRRSFGRNIASLVNAQGKLKSNRVDGIDSSEVNSIVQGEVSSGVSYFDTLDSLPTTGLSSGLKALVKVSSTEGRLYIYNGQGWYNADTNLNTSAPVWSTEPDATYTIADSATPLIVTALASDADGDPLTNQSFVTDSAQYMVDITNDSSVWTFTPKTKIQIGAAVAAGNLTDSNGDFVYTFKWSDGINFVSKAATISYSPSAFTGINWNGTRALAPGGNSPTESYSHSNVIQYFDITTLGDAQDFGDLTELKNGVCAVSSGQRCVIMGGQGRTSTQTPPGSGRYLDEMEYVAFNTPGNAVSFGLLGTGVHDAAAGSNGTRGIIGGGDAGPSSSTATDVIQYITIDTTSASSAFGNLTAETHMGMSTQDDTSLGFLEGYTSSGGFGYRNTNTWVTMDTLGNSVNQGSFTYGMGNGGKGVCSDNTYGVVFGGNQDYTSGGVSWNNYIYYLTIATKSDASDFGDCLTSLGHAGQTSYAQTKRGVSIGGFYNPGTVTIDTISYIVIDTPGNAQDFGDLTQATEYSYGVSGNAA